MPGQLSPPLEEPWRLGSAASLIGRFLAGPCLEERCQPVFTHSQASLCSVLVFQPSSPPRRCLCWLFNLELFSAGEKFRRQRPELLDVQSKGCPTTRSLSVTAPTTQLQVSALEDEGKCRGRDETRTETSNKADCCVHHRHPGGKGDVAMLICGSHPWITCFKTMLAQG